MSSILWDLFPATSPPTTSSILISILPNLSSIVNSFSEYSLGSVSSLVGDWHPSFGLYFLQCQQPLVTYNSLTTYESYSILWCIIRMLPHDPAHHYNNSLSIQPYHIIQCCNTPDHFLIILNNLTTITLHSHALSLSINIFIIPSPQFLPETPVSTHSTASFLHSQLQSHKFLQTGSLQPLIAPHCNQLFSHTVILTLLLPLVWTLYFPSKLPIPINLPFLLCWHSNPSRSTLYSLRSSISLLRSVWPYATLLCLCFLVAVHHILPGLAFSCYYTKSNNNCMVVGMDIFRIWYMQSYLYGWRK